MKDRSLTDWEDYLIRLLYDQKRTRGWDPSPEEHRVAKEAVRLLGSKLSTALSCQFDCHDTHVCGQKFANLGVPPCLLIDQKVDTRIDFSRLSLTWNLVGCLAERNIVPGKLQQIVAIILSNGFDYVPLEVLNLVPDPLKFSTAPPENLEPCDFQYTMYERVFGFG